tara:strand:+ start:123 stop:248 length:126 start_codon:yes stop_codon:yes gene_type:complete
MGLMIGLLVRFACRKFGFGSTPDAQTGHLRKKRAEVFVEED